MSSGSSAFRLRAAAARVPERIEVCPLQDFVNLQRLIGEVEINIVPLQDNAFTNCKSELKYFEAAIVETVTVATPTYTFSRVRSGTARTASSRARTIGTRCSSRRSSASTTCRVWPASPPRTPSLAIRPRLRVTRCGPRSWRRRAPAQVPRSRRLPRATSDRAGDGAAAGSPSAASSNERAERVGSAAVPFRRPAKNSISPRRVSWNHASSNGQSPSRWVSASSRSHAPGVKTEQWTSMCASSACRARSNASGSPRSGRSSAAVGDRCHGVPLGISAVVLVASNTCRTVGRVGERR